MVRVVIIDEHPLFREGVRAVLSAQSDLRVVAEAGCAEEGYAAVESAQPDVVLLDLGLAGPGGIAAARELLRRDPRNKILLFSARVEEHSVVDALAVGALGYAGKGQPVPEILQAVRAVAQGRTYLPPGVSAAAVEHRLRRGRNGPLGVLSAREREVFHLLVRGYTNEIVGEHLRISRRTVETHRSRILKKLRVHSAVELIRLAAQHGLL
jgi:DNA-binding NarL/FixJ family response regulator